MYSKMSLPTFTFHSPPLDYSLTYLDMIDYNMLHSTDHPVFQYRKPDGTTHSITWKEAGSAFCRAARFIQLKYSAVEPPEDSNTPLVVGIFANVDSITYISLMVGVMLAGMTPFLISNRNSPSAVAHLLREGNCKSVIASQDDITQTLISTALNILKTDPKSLPILLLSSPTYDDLFGSGDHVYPPLGKLHNISHDSVCVIIHTSGSVAFPKPVKLSFRMLLEHGIAASKGEVDLCGVFGAHGIPIYHTFGVYLFASCVTLGMTLSLLSPNENHIPSPEMILMQAVQINCSIIATVPSFIENWAHDKHKVELLKRFTAVIFGGGPLSTAVGDMLVEEGVNIIPMYGLTEVGTVSMILPAKPPSEGWEWLKTGNGTDLVFIPAQTADENIFRLVVKPNKMKSIAVSNTTVDGIAAFDTNDLVARHPTNPLLWKIFGREDDQIIHSTGEKTNPTPIEGRLLKDPKISAAVIFGRSKFQPGVLVQPSATYAFDPNDRFKLDEYRELIWPTVEEANKEAPQHSRIYKEYILVASPSKPFEFTAKGTPRRNAVLEAYAYEIEQVYIQSDGQAPSKVAVSVDWNVPQTREVLRKIFASVLRRDFADNESIFVVGGDSLAAVSIRNSLTRALHESKLLSYSQTMNIPSDIVYMFPTVDTLTAYVYGLLSLAPISAHTSTSEADDALAEDECAALLSADVKESTVVKLRIGNPAEIPLIILHGAGGSVSDFLSMSERYISALWAIQITEEAPLTSIDALAEFYYGKVKDEQPVGPYRLASYSGSSVILVRLVQLFESKGDIVSQFAFLDHIPTLYFHGLDDVWNSDFRSSLSRQAIVDKETRRGAEFVCKLVKESSTGADKEFRKRFADDMLAALDGRSSGELSRLRMRNICALVKISLEFLLGDSFCSFDENRKLLSKEKISQWMRNVKNRPIIYIAKDGLGSMLGIDLGAREVYSDARVVEIGGNHFSFLVNPELLRHL